ncbi:transcriptional regulator [Pelagirhabdus alkalitolerans]|uniref:Transcriptional regulator CtsR n=1 Tax=Pelagirhabdus alkalitolerans TaxID=1612202 RepID=A0A1G6MCB8_9BACI|nr:CtsR family transcriptional regulator [Pelagirhabdus alkalitolerans]SDC53071.1 transcriptional regulator [Pelagirhabdus alkalitolerans]
MRHNISDVIEAHLKQIIEQNNRNIIEIKRSELAARFSCVPSQINYVINTRFTEERGYLVESKRGGGGYIRIQRLVHSDKTDLLTELIEAIGREVSQQVATAIIERLVEDRFLTVREAKLMISVLDREVLAFQLPTRDELRARLLKSMLVTLKYH